MAITYAPHTTMQGWAGNITPWTMDCPTDGMQSIALQWGTRLADLVLVQPGDMGVGLLPCQKVHCRHPCRPHVSSEGGLA